MKYKALSLILCIVMLLSACKPMEVYHQRYASGMNDKPDLSYEVPVVTPHILVDQFGYLKDSGKVAILRGNILPDTFTVRNAETGKAVYEGKVRPKTVDEHLLGYADFSSVVEEGTYYIESGVLGRSFDFEISNRVYDEIFTDFISKLLNVRNKKINVQIAGNKEEQKEKIIQGGWITDGPGNQNLVTGAHAVTALLAAYEFHPGAFCGSGDKEEVPVLLKTLKKQIVWMQALQEETTGGVYDGVRVTENETGYIYRMNKMSAEASISYAAALAKFSYIYKEYDEEFAAGCLKLADRAFRYAVNSGENLSEKLPLLFCAAAELYRASGQSQYHLKVIEFLNQMDSLGQDFWTICGSLTYLSTYQKINVDYCDAMIKNIMESAEKVSDKIRKANYFMKVEEQPDFSEMLWDILLLSSGNYIIQNYEYSTMIEECQHFLAGGNFGNKNYLLPQNDEENTEEVCLKEDIIQSAYYICFLSQIIENIQ